MKPENVSQVYKALNKFDDLRLTVDMFQNEVPNFLHLELSPDGISFSKIHNYWPRC